METRQATCVSSIGNRKSEIGNELPIDSLLSVADAIRILDAAPVASRVETVELLRAEGLVLARDVRADRDYPPFDKSLVDGYAVRTSPSPGTPGEGWGEGLPAKQQSPHPNPLPGYGERGPSIQLRLIGEVSAGKSFDRPLAPGECVAIMTGAPLPIGADAAVPIERTARAGDVVTVPSGVRSRDCVALRASDVAYDAMVLSRGSLVGPAQLAVLAQVGASAIDVFARPRAAILVTGDEIVDVDRVPAGSQIRDCNSYLLRSLLERLGCEVVHVARCHDTRDATRAAIEACIALSDVTFITGGMSMGAYDFVPSTLLDLGFELPITKLRIKPGKPFVWGRGKGSGVRVRGSEAGGRTSDAKPLSLNPEPLPLNPPYVFGLPGNPVSAFCCTVRLASRVIDRMRGLPAPRERWTHGPLGRDLPANGPREFYQPAVLCDDGAIDPLDWKGSADVFTLARADALLVRAENDPARRAGDGVRALILP
jgi:molybdopterin molybdotransferase